MKIFVLVFFILCFFCANIASIGISCNFNTNYAWETLGNVYTCEAFNQGDIITDRSNRNIDTISGSSNPNPKVKVVYISGSNCFYYPLGLEKLFANLEGLLVYNSKLKEIKREDFKDYKNLRMVYITGNEIQYLEPNLFEFVPKLESILLHNNQIAHIDANVFDNFVGKLNTLYLSDNICQFENVHNNKLKANQIIGRVQSGSCKDESKLPATTTTTTPVPTTTSTTTATTTAAPITNTAPAQLDALKELINLQESLMQEVKALRGEIKAQKDEFVKLEASVKSQVQLSEDIKASLSNITAQNEQCGTCVVELLEKRVKFIEKTIGVDPLLHNQP